MHILPHFSHRAEQVSHAHESEISLCCRQPRQNVTSHTSHERMHSSQNVSSQPSQ